MVDRDKIYKTLIDFIEHDPGNKISRENAVDEKDIGKRMFKSPIMAIGRADDKLWDIMKNEPAANLPIYKTPREWMPGAKSVITFFAPLEDEIITSNRKDKNIISSLWLAQYREEQPFLNKAVYKIEDMLRAEGYEACDPYADGTYRFTYNAGMFEDMPENAAFTSSWSVRHAAYVCGLGSFGLQRGIITEKGAAGRIEAIITTAEFDRYDERYYTGLTDNCTKCGACIKVCPVGAISMENSKDHSICFKWLSHIESMYEGCDCCGKCHSRVPCAQKIPGMA